MYLAFVYVTQNVRDEYSLYKEIIKKCWGGVLTELYQRKEKQRNSSYKTNQSYQQIMLQNSQLRILDKTFIK